MISTISQAFQEAIEENTPQIKNLLNDGKGGYCATGWLIGHGIETMSQLFGDWERWLTKQYPVMDHRSLRIVAYLNDIENWDWKRFKEEAVRFEALYDAKVREGDSLK